MQQRSEIRSIMNRRYAAALLGLFSRVITWFITFVVHIAPRKFFIFRCKKSQFEQQIMENYE